ncbi:hypothetical protein K502DRAFT_288019 [Neoconidiobolus thromboides FSU 785]|nr:hypothetical protein K502DRAFT_288019 [Neoconidiobolus thromboides FSU 785]
MQFTSKIVTRSYAFDTPENIPKQAEYFKLKYQYKKCPFANIVKGETFSHVFGKNTSLLELFLVKRKLMGPCWVKITNCSPAENKLSHCKAEYNVHSPKFVSPLSDDEIEKFNFKTPPINIMSFSIKTILNKKSNVNEIAMINLSVFQSTNIEENFESDRKNIIRIGAINQIPNAYIPTNLQSTLASKGFEIQVTTSERALLNYIVSRIRAYDPDVYVGHNFLGFSLEVLLNRFEALNISDWSSIGRLRRTAPLKNLIGSGHLASYQNRNLVNGRIICDTYLGAKDAVKSKSYSLNQLCKDQLNITKEEIDFEKIAEYFLDEGKLYKLFQSSALDADFSAALMFKLQLLPLSKQLTTLAGNLWNHTITGARAKRNEYLLLHEFHKLKYICPDKKPFTKDVPEDEEAQENDNTSRRKAAYAGGLVLDPKRGLYDNLVLLLDFNSLYPSIIQEYNICFTTVDRDPSTDDLPEVPEKNMKTGLLPKLLSTLIERRVQVKKLLKDKNLSPSKLAELDIRQKALKLTANSMYGCLGYPLSRFYAKQLAMLITSKGREVLQSTVELADNDGLEVIYGDTDSIMINTHTLELPTAKQIAHQFKKKVNQKYKNLEIDIDGVFKSLLLLQKKKYAALVIQELKFDTIKGQKENYKTHIEVKGLDLVRREFCELSQEMSQHILDQILSGNERDAIVTEVHEYLRKMSSAIRNRDIPAYKFMIFKSISKPLDKYQDAQSQPQVQVALRLQKARGAPFVKGETVNYIICKSEDEEVNKKSYAMRAYSFDEFTKSNGTLEVDFEWYFTRQILPPISRLCDCIEGTSSGNLADCLGLDSRKYSSAISDELGSESLLDSLVSETERFSGIEPLELNCKKCEKSFKFNKFAVSVNQIPTLGNTCPGCNEITHTFYLQNSIENSIRKHIHKFNQGWLKCNEFICGQKTRCISLQAHPTSGKGKKCSKAGCEGTLYLEITPQKLYNVLSYYLHLFDYKGNIKALTASGIDHGKFFLL